MFLDDGVRVVVGVVQLFNGFEVSPVCDVSVSCCTCEDGTRRFAPCALRACVCGVGVGFLIDSLPRPVS